MGKSIIIKPRVNIHFPWKLIIGDNVWIGEGAIILAGSIIQKGSIIPAYSIVNGLVISKSIFKKN